MWANGTLDKLRPGDDKESGDSHEPQRELAAHQNVHLGLRPGEVLVADDHGLQARARLLDGALAIAKVPLTLGLVGIGFVVGAIAVCAGLWGQVGGGRSGVRGRKSPSSAPQSSSSPRLKGRRRDMSREHRACERQRLT